MPPRQKKRYLRPAGKGVHKAIRKEGFAHRRNKKKPRLASRPPAAKKMYTPATKQAPNRRLVRAASFSYGYGNGILVDQQLNALARLAFCRGSPGEGKKAAAEAGPRPPPSRVLGFGPPPEAGDDVFFYYFYSKAKARRLRVYRPDVDPSARLWRRKYDYSHLGPATRGLYQRLVAAADFPLRLETVHPMAMDVWYFLLHQKKFRPLFSQLAVAGPLALLKKKTLAAEVRAVLKEPPRGTRDDADSAAKSDALVDTSIDQVWWCPATGALWLIEIKKDQHISREQIYARTRPRAKTRPRSKSVGAAATLGEFLQRLAKNHSGSAAAQVAINHMLFLHSHLLVRDPRPAAALEPPATERRALDPVGVRSALCVVNTAGIHFIEIV